ncbi:MAG: protein kinase [Proteobacteria bacterium]|nr:protein kinase [Pseudomonadota bacterium]
MRANGGSDPRLSASADPRAEDVEPGSERSAQRAVEAPEDRFAGERSGSGTAPARPARPEMAATEVDLKRRSPETAGESGNSSVGSWIGRVLDERYRVTELLGEGGMGAVFVAEHLKLRKQVALKLIRPDFAGNGEVAARFAREAMATARFEHPHVASAIDYGMLAEGGAYLVTQLVRGHSLRELLERDERLGWRRACEIGAQIADALAAAKTEGIVHRDLKPDNILIQTRDDGSDLVKILDFGIARFASVEQPHGQGPAAVQLTRVGTVVGTPGYMAPEQAVGDEVDHRADLYALGTLMWECIAGRRLWRAPDLTAQVAKQFKERTPSLRQWDPTVPRELDALVSALCAPIIEQRPDCPGQVRDTLRRLCVGSSSLPGSLPLSGQIVARLRRHVQAVADVVPRLQRLRNARAWPRPRVQTGALLGAAAALLLMAVWIVSLTGGDGKATTTQARVSPPPGGAEPPPGKPGSRSNFRAAAREVQRKSPAPRNPLAGGKTSAPRSVRPSAVKATGGQSARARDHASAQERRADVQELMTGHSARSRRAAAARIVAQQQESSLPRYVRRVIALERASTCSERRQVIHRMVDDEDSAVAPALMRIHEASWRGCGFLGLGDCYSCERETATAALRALGALPHDPQGSGERSGERRSRARQLERLTSKPRHGLKVQYRAGDDRTGDDRIAPHFRIVNVGSRPVRLSDLTLRYWYTRAGGGRLRYRCEAAEFGCDNVRARFVPIRHPVRGADEFIELGFARAAGVLAPGQATGDIRGRIVRLDRGPFNEKDDYSFGEHASFTDWDRVTLYRDGDLVWGIEAWLAAKLKR